MKLSSFDEILPKPVTLLALILFAVSEGIHPRNLNLVNLKLRHRHYDNLTPRYFPTRSSQPGAFRDRGHLRISNGKAISHLRYPYAVLLSLDPIYQMPFTRVCTGSLITEHWVLTAAHCFKGKSKNATAIGLYITYGNLTLKETPNRQRVLQTHPHPDFDPRFLPEPTKNDIGLALVERTPVATFGKISAVDALTLIGASVKYIGAGITVDNELLVKKPREAYEIVLSDEYRELQIGEALVIKCDEDEKLKLPHSICLRAKCSNRRQKANIGDSGGPLLYRRKIIGVGCCKVPHGSNAHMFYYTSVSPFLDWIQDVIKTEEVIKLKIFKRVSSTTPDSSI